LMTALITHAQTVDHVWMESTITRVAAWQVIPGITVRKVRSSIDNIDRGCTNIEPAPFFGKETTGSLAACKYGFPDLVSSIESIWPMVSFSTMYTVFA